MKLDNNEFIMVTKTGKKDQEAVEEKMKALSPKLFGLFNPVSYELKTKRKVYSQAKTSNLFRIKEKSVDSANLFF